MNFECDPTKELDFLCLNNYNSNTLKTIKTHNKCEVCNGSNYDFDSHKLCCNHTVHSRCYRRYVYQEEEISCPECGVLDWHNDAPTIISKKTITIGIHGSIELLWIKFFRKLKWKWSYTKDKKNNFVLNFKKMNIPVRFVTTEKYEDLIDIANGIKNKKEILFLLLGCRPFSVAECIEQLDEYSENYMILGLLCYKLDCQDEINEIYNSPALIIKDGLKQMFIPLDGLTNVIGCMSLIV